MKKITKETKLVEILENPEIEKVLIKYNFPCIGCPLAKEEMEELKLGQICNLYGIDCEKLIEELNEVLKK